MYRTNSPIKYTTIESDRTIIISYKLPVSPASMARYSAIAMRIVLYDIMAIG